MIVDGYDVVFPGPLDGARWISTLQQTAAELLFCSTTADWPPDAAQRDFERACYPGYPWPHLSAGGVFGRTESFMQFADEVISSLQDGQQGFRYQQGFDDQHAWREIHLKHFPRVQVDSSRTLFARFDQTSVGRFFPYLS
jgi:hypothetical protein